MLKASKNVLAVIIYAFIIDHVLEHSVPDSLNSENNAQWEDSSSNGS